MKHHVMSLLVCVLVLAAERAQAQPVTLTSNFTEADHADSPLDIAHLRDRSQAFRAGTSTYRLVSVSVKYQDAEGDPLDLKICEAVSATSRIPTSVCWNLTPPSSFTGTTSAVELEYTDPSRTDLVAEKFYTVVFISRDSGKSVSVSETGSTAEEQIGSQWWINEPYHTLTSGAWEPEGTGATRKILKIQVKGEPIPVIPNRAPVKTRDVENVTIEKESTEAVEIGDAFRDPDGDMLTFAVTSSHPAIASVSLSGTTATITAHNIGTATITVTATDDGTTNNAPDPKTLSQTFRVRVVPIFETLVGNFGQPSGDRQVIADAFTESQPLMQPFSSNDVWAGHIRQITLLSKDDSAALSDRDFSLKVCPAESGRAAPLGAHALTNLARVETDSMDMTAPALLLATVDGTTLELTYNEGLDEFSVPAMAAYAVTVAGSAATVDQVVVDGGTVTLTLATAVTGGQTVTLRYTPGTNPVRDAAGNDAAALTAQSVTNLTLVTGTNATPPVLLLATVDGSTLELTYNEMLDMNSVPARGDFAVTVDDGRAFVDQVQVSGGTVTLGLDTAVTSGEAVRLYYTPGTNPVRDAGGTLPGARCTAFTTASEFVQDTDVIFTTSTPYHVDSGTSHVVVLTATGSDPVKIASTQAANEDGSRGWEIRDRFRHGQDGGWIDFAQEHSLLIKIEGEPLYDPILDVGVRNKSLVSPVWPITVTSGQALAPGFDMEIVSLPRLGTLALGDPEDANAYLPLSVGAVLPWDLIVGRGVFYLRSYNDYLKEDPTVVEFTVKLVRGDTITGPHRTRIKVERLDLCLYDGEAHSQQWPFYGLYGAGDASPAPIELSFNPLVSDPQRWCGHTGGGCVSGTEGVDYEWQRINCGCVGWEGVHCPVDIALPPPPVTTPPTSTTGTGTGTTTGGGTGGGGGGGGSGGGSGGSDEDTELHGFLENPGPDSFQSGIGVISGWVCEADMVELAIGAFAPQAAAYGTERLDTEDICGDTDNGFGLLFNWNLLGDGEHEVVAVVDGMELGRTTVTVTTLDEEFVRDVAGACVVEDFPDSGRTVTVEWQQNSQNFVLAGPTSPAGENQAGPPGVGVLENPGPNSFQSGIGVISGWVCEADMVELAIGAFAPQAAAYGTERLDTEDICGDTDNGFGLLFNWNLLGDGEHEVVAVVDGEELGRATVQVTTLGAEFVRDVAGECMVEDFPMTDETVTLAWQQNNQNFVIVDRE